MTTASNVRPTAVAGRFYPDDPAELEAAVEGYLASAQAAPARAVGLLAPHAGYIYSGGVAGVVFARAVIPRRVVVLAPNHTGRGQPIALWSRGAFALPGGDVSVDEELCDELLAGQSIARFASDREAHRHEHALEVELPFLRARRPDLRVTPIVLGSLGLAACEAIGRELARVAALAGEDVLVVASSDMSHYLSDAETRTLDRRALEPLLALDAARLYHTVRDEGLSMCGVIPATVMLFYAVARGATRATLEAYATSGDAFGERERVVGYAGVVVN